MTNTTESKATRGVKWSDALSIITSVALLVAAITVTASTLARPKPPARVEPKVPASLQSIKGLPLKGNTAAAVALIVYSDFQCPFCQKFATDVMPTLEEKYISSGQLVLAFRHYPLETIHPLARGAHEAAACAFRQGRFWELHDQFFKPGASFDAAGLFSAAALAKVNPDEWQKCILARPVKEVADDLAVGQELQIRGTPLFHLGISTPDGVKVTKVWSGARPIAFFAQAIEESVLVASKLASKR